MSAATDKSHRNSKTPSDRLSASSTHSSSAKARTGSLCARLPPLAAPKVARRKSSPVRAPKPDQRRLSVLIDHVKNSRISHGQTIEEDEIDRRQSVPFPVTAWSSRHQLTPEERNRSLGGRPSRSPRPLRNSHSQNDIGDKEPVKHSQAWRVSMLVSRAKRRLSATNDLIKSRRISLTDFLRVAMLKRPDSEKKKLIRQLKKKAHDHKKNLLTKFRQAVNITIFCARKFKEHCLRLNEQNDELAPYIKRLHFHEDDETDLLIDLSKFKANRQMRIPEETKRILSIMPTDARIEAEVYSVTLALRNIKSFAEYPKQMQQKIAQVGLYEKYESKRVVVRQGHPASAFYFILSGAVVVMVMEEDSNYARPVAHLYKGQTFGELAIVHGTKRQSTVICKETCEFMSISAKDYHKIFMAGGVKNIGDPDQEIFLRSLSCLANWPIHILQENTNKCQFLFFKNADVIVRDSHFSDWLIIVKSGSVQVLKKLKRVEAFEWKRKKPLGPLSNKDRRDIYLKQVECRRVLPELKIPLQRKGVMDDFGFLGNGRPVPFEHPGSGESEGSETPRSEDTFEELPALNQADMKPSYRLLDGHPSNNKPLMRTQSLLNRGAGTINSKTTGQTLRRVRSQRFGGPKRDRSDSMIQEENDELLGYQPHIRTIMEDIDPNINLESVETNAADINPEFVHVQTLTKGEVFGLTDLIIGSQPSFSVVSRGADCLLINKNLYMEHASEKLLRDMRQELCPYPSEQELQERLQVSVDWQQYKRSMLRESLEHVTSRRLMRTALHGTKTQEAFVF